MMVTMAPWTRRVDQDRATVQGGAASCTEVERRVAPDVERAAPRPRAMAARQGRLRPAERTNSWPLAAGSGDTTPAAFQQLLRRALGDPEAVRDARRRSSVPPLEAPEAGLGREDTGVLKQGRHDWERLVTFYQFPREHWRQLRTTNVVESPFAAVRLRTTAAKRFKKVDSATAMIWKVLQVAESTFRRLNAPELLPAVYAGTRYVDGIKHTVVSQREVAA